MHDDQAYLVIQVPPAHIQYHGNHDNLEGDEDRQHQEIEYKLEIFAAIHIPGDRVGTHGNQQENQNNRRYSDQRRVSEIHEVIGLADNADKVIRRPAAGHRKEVGRGFRLRFESGNNHDVEREQDHDNTADQKQHRENFEQKSTRSYMFSSCHYASPASFPLLPLIVKTEIMATRMNRIIDSATA